jgi:hypothetical protein
MLVIRQAQLTVFREHLRDKFRLKAAAHLRENFPEECEKLGEEGVRDRVSSGLARCEQYGLPEKFQILQFLNLTMLLGPDFDKEPQFTEILNNTALDGRTKLDRMDEQAILRLSES